MTKQTTLPVKQTTSLPVTLLLNYREFDRVAEPAPYIGFPGVEYYTVDSLTEKVKAEGIKSAVELIVYNGKALLVEGNHRVVTYSRLSYSECPVTITYYNSEEDLKNAFYSHTIARMKKMGASMKAELLNIA